MKISLIVAAGIAVVAAKKPKRIESEFQDAKERGLNDVEESMIAKCGGKPAAPANAKDVDCWLSWDQSKIWCEAVCPAGYQPENKTWTSCRWNHSKERRRKFGNQLGPCIPLCPDMDEALKTLPDNVHVQREVKDGWRQEFYGIPTMKFSCTDKQDQLTIKGRFQT